MKHLIKNWRRFVVGLGYWKASLLHGFLVLPPLFLAFWIAILHTLPNVFGAPHAVALSAITAGPLLLLWTALPLILGFLTWPMCHLGLRKGADAGQVEGDRRR